MPAASNPVIARLWRGDHVESLHRGCWVITDVDGKVLHSAGDPEQQVYARSSTKSLQALPMIESGAAEALGLTLPEIAIAVSSHNGQPEHVSEARRLLARVGLDEDALQCGPQQPAGSAVDSEATRITNNCSGKHAAFLAAAVSFGDDPADYLDPASALQRQVRQAVLTMTGAEEADVSTAIDGCSAPTFRLPLQALATGAARLSNPEGLAPARRDACERIVAAAQAFPALVGGTSTPRFDTAVLTATGGRVFAKVGAEGVQIVGVVGSGIGFAAKVDDGSTRSLHRLTIEVLNRLGHLEPDELAPLGRWHDPVLRNRDNVTVGRHEIIAANLPTAP